MRSKYFSITVRPTKKQFISGVLWFASGQVSSMSMEYCNGWFIVSEVCDIGSDRRKTKFDTMADAVRHFKERLSFL